MKPRITLLVVFIMLSSMVRGEFVTSHDSIVIPQKLMDLPSVVQNTGDREGPWGLPTIIAVRYGLIVSDSLDERHDADASAAAATAYLRDMYKEFGNWDLCYYAYLYSPAYLRSLQVRHLDTIVYNFDISQYRESLKSRPIPKPVVKAPVNKKTYASKTAKPKEQRFITYTVKQGDTLNKIAKKYHVTVNDLKKWNNLKGDLIRDKQKLRIRQ